MQNLNVKNFSYLDRYNCFITTVIILFVDARFQYLKYVVGLVSACICATLPAPNEDLTAGTQ